MAELLEIGLGNAVGAALLAVPVAVMARLCRRPAVAHALWLLVLIKLLVPVGVRVHVPWPESAPAESAAAAELDQDALTALAEGSVAPPARTIEDLEADIRALQATLGPALEPAEEPASSTDTDVRWSAFVGGLWLLGSFCWAVWTGLNVKRFRRLVCHARRAPSALLREVEALASQLGLRRVPSVYLVSGRISPMVWGLCRTPILLLPARLLRNLNQDQLRGLLLHELAHLRRGDQWVRLVELLAVGLYWWYPLLWWARRELHEAEEQCCDAWVIAMRQGGERDYASALLETVAFLSRTPMPLPVAASGIGNVPHLRRRLTMIMQGQKAHSLTWTGFVAVGLLGLLLPLSPAQGQPQPKPEPKPNVPGQDPRDRAIEALKMQIQKLEAEKRAHKEKEAATALKDLAERVQFDDEARFKVAKRLKDLQVADADAAKLEATAAALKQQIDAKRKELEMLQMRLEEIVTNLAQRKAKDKLKSTIEKIETRGKEAKAVDIDIRLERLLKEVDELKRDIQQRKAKPEAPGKDPLFKKTPPVKEPPQDEELLEKKKELDLYERGVLRKERLDRLKAVEPNTP
jgi:beta-lactamase regulating signal transducer with metallopeptidase domain